MGGLDISRIVQLQVKTPFNLSYDSEVVIRRFKSQQEGSKARQLGTTDKSGLTP